LISGAPTAARFQREEGGDFHELLGQVTARLEGELGGIAGALIETKKASVAAHYRLVADAERGRVKDVVEAILAEHPNDLKVDARQDGLRDPA
jgi:trehalose-6-phosphatase